MIESALAQADIDHEISRFHSLYAQRPLRRNLGGMRYNHSFALWFILDRLQPSLIVESGVFQGHSTWLIEQTCPGAQLFCLDVDFSRLLYKSERAAYIQKDFAQCSWRDLPKQDALCFFDDHQNAYQRLKDLRWAGFKRAVFDDNHPCGEGDCYSLKHMLAGFGHPRMQMSEKFQGNEDERQRRAMFEDIVKVAGPRQQLLVPPNEEDRDLFWQNCRSYVEFPPVALAPRSATWDKEYQGAYETKPPLIAPQSLPPAIKDMLASDASEFDYSFMAYVELT
ncbi:MAG: hypothetical protein HQL44_11610 [Alphaproteobacteria bacterium]|nr:hypothetical protein [Alphaproteobacteria bacterium]